MRHPFCLFVVFAAAIYANPCLATSGRKVPEKKTPAKVEKNEESEAEPQASAESPLGISFELGIPTGVHSDIIKNAESIYNVRSGSGSGSYLTSLRLNYSPQRPTKFFYSGGIGILSGSLTRSGASYSQGSLKLTVSQTEFVFYGNFGYKIMPQLALAVGLDSYFGILEEFKVSSPTGGASGSPERSVMPSAHATRVSALYSLSPKIALTLNGYLKPIYFNFWSERGFDGLTVGVLYGL